MKKLLLTSLLTLLPLVSLQAEGLHIEGVKTLLSEAQLMVTEINATALYKMLDEDEEFFLIDLRGQQQQGHGEIYHMDSFKIKRGYLEFQVEEKIPNKKAKVILYCCSGKRSILAAKSLIRMGYKDVLSLKEGLKGWVDQGLPLDTIYGEMILKND